MNLYSDSISANQCPLDTGFALVGNFITKLLSIK